MRIFSNLFATILFVLLSAHSVSAQSVTLNPFATLSGTTENEQLGTTLRKADINGDGKPELFIGAPGYSSAFSANTGRIYLISLPVETDTALTVSNVIIQGSSAEDNIGRFFQLGDFNGDNYVDVVLWNPYQNNNAGKVSIFFGPFNPGEVRTSNNPDVSIDGGVSEQMGSSVAVVPAANKSGLLIGASGYNDFAGRAYFFEDLSQFGAFTNADATVTFNGQIGFDLFGSTVQFLGDINGDSNFDFAVSSTKHSNNLALQGAVYIFYGPFNNPVYELSAANITLFGRNESTLWAGKIFNHGDINNDGFSDFSLGSDGDESGIIALFMGRETWADSIQIGTQAGLSDKHQIITVPGSVGFGFSVDFNGDYNFDGKKDFIFGARYTSSNIGVTYVTNSSGASPAPIYGGTTNVDGFFGTQVLHLGSINSKEVDPYGIDDLVISAPGAYSTEKWGSLKTGVLTFFTGSLNPPKSTLTISNGRNVTEIGDSVKISISSTVGSRPIKINKLRILTRPNGVLATKDTLDFPTGSSNSSSKWFKIDRAGQIELEHYIEDDFGITALSQMQLNFAAKPEPFNLITEFPNTVVLQGDRTTEIDFHSEASADSNGASIQYELLLSADETSFVNGSGLNILKVGNSPDFTLSYQELNNYLISSGFLSLNVESAIYWSIRAKNRNGSYNLFSILADNGPRVLKFIRLGLDPYFDITTGKKRLFLIEGLDTDYFETKWSSLITENPNAIIDYRFKLVKDTTKEKLAKPVIEEYANTSDNNSFKLHYGDLVFLLQEAGVFDLAKEDTLHWFYTVEAILDGDENNPILPKQAYQKVDIKYSVLVNTAVEEELLSETPEKFEIYPNYPNPFNPTTQLKFAIPEPSTVRIVVYNMLGQVVYNWSSAGLVTAGFQEHTINGRGWSSGIYIYQIQVGNNRLTGKMSLVK